MKPQEVRRTILQVIDRIQGGNQNKIVNDASIAAEVKISVDDVRGHLAILNREDRIKLIDSSSGYVVYFNPVQHQLLREELETQQDPEPMQTTAKEVIGETKVFLSHKGSDKPLVRRFFTVLKTIGFDPWLDEDAMIAGTELERGILQGFKDSCAAVFFITPNFLDEGFLRTEVNYAIGEKRVKGDRFAIITIVFTGKKGEKGAVPELLKQYVWKEPPTDLEAINEILRAMPIAPGEPRWRA